MIIIKELFLSLILGAAIAGLLTVILVNNPKIWYKTAKKIKSKQKDN
ncbi:hypothetical protein [Enterococcus caccae]|uniref:Uncharacterized protein n=1 Tax=Enterococcus caccae ATCC BAA-1240 TaxID=1158612 RepID=R3WTF8_9ENTE|nr:hypothetical protein [Enterococcus caccae]EOL45095.1 hypothetical protein UC7_01901 [Enterococcus caccae ATCC BAA-1240]EOT58502.1 hypothetical protein I580_02673 [Enterococcus caccae ATCC BAA-1240]